MAGWGVTQTRIIRGSPVKVRALPDRAKHVKVKVKRCEVGGARAEFDYPVGVLCASDRGEWMIDDERHAIPGPATVDASFISSSLFQTRMHAKGIPVDL